MATCNDCIHDEACKSQVPRTFWDSKDFCVGCEHFKDKSRYIELPCKVGDIVWALWDVPNKTKYVVYCAEVKKICVSKKNCRLTTIFLLEPLDFRGRLKEYRLDEFRKLFFLTYEEAEKKLKE